MEIWIDLQLFAEQEKTEEATPHRKQEVRKEGQVAKSSDLNAVANLLAVFLILMFGYRYFVEDLCSFISLALSEGLLKSLTDSELLYIFTDASFFMLKFLAPIFVVGLAAGLIANFGQVGFLYAPKAIKPKLSHLNPIEGFKRLFSKRALVELLKALLKIVAVGWVAFSLVRDSFEQLLLTIYMGAFQVLQVFVGVLFKVAAGAVGVFLFIAIMDYIFQRYEFRMRIRMTKKEVKDEFKQTEGDPLLRSRVKEKQRELARQRMMHSVPEATVVITNPTHLAVALRYEKGKDAAPQVVAKGRGFIAQKIIELAREHGVPVIENKPVAQTLFKDVEIGQTIPPDLYKAVAEVLAMIYRLKGKRF